MNRRLREDSGKVGLKAEDLPYASLGLQANLTHLKPNETKTNADPPMSCPELLQLSAYKGRKAS